jgi:hypothetical protein
MLILGSTRSGSTWLAEIVTAVSGTLQIFEPMNDRYVASARKVGIERDLYRKPSEDWAEGSMFFKSVLAGKIVNPWILSQSSLSKTVSAERLVIKIVRGTLLTGWLSEKITKLPPALVIRHPCAIISSQLSKGWPTGKKQLLDNPYMLTLPDIRQKCQSLSEPEELLALAWCLRYHSCLTLKKPYPFILVCYESLITNGSSELEGLFNAWGLTINDVIRKQMDTPSQTVTGLSSVVKGGNPLSGWEKMLNPKEVKNILNVLSLFNIDFYNEGLEPDYEKLARFGD